MTYGTLARDFGAEYVAAHPELSASEAMDEWTRRHYTNWLATRVRREEWNSAQEEVQAALDVAPAMLVWASWPMIREMGRNILRQPQESIARW